MTDIFQSLTEEVFTHVLKRPSSMLTTKEEVRKLCERNACGHYGKNWACPPAVQPIDALREELEAFDTLLIMYKAYELEDSMDWEGMMRAAKDFQKKLRGLKKKIKKAAPNTPFLILGAGACRLCSPCTYPSGEPCNYPEEAIVSLEAYGIDVMKLMKDNEVEYNSGPNTVTYIGGVLYSSHES